MPNLRGTSPIGRHDRGRSYVARPVSKGELVGDARGGR